MGGRPSKDEEEHPEPRPSQSVGESESESESEVGDKDHVEIGLEEDDVADLAWVFIPHELAKDRFERCDARELSGVNNFLPVLGSLGLSGQHSGRWVWRLGVKTDSVSVGIARDDIPRNTWIGCGDPASGCVWLFALVQYSCCR
jgi:hypothetical protein